MHTYHVYILASQRNGTLYIGVTNDLSRRVKEHKDGNTPCFTKQYKVDMLVYAEEHQYIHDAIRREKQLKKWKRAWKLRLIEESNPEWEDFYFSA
jgi:putative endonuclease